MDLKVKQAVEKLKKWVNNNDKMELVFYKEDIPKDGLYSELPPSFIEFIDDYGFFYVEYYGEKFIELMPPELLIDAGLETFERYSNAEQAIAFQRIDNDAVDNFYCFNKNFKLDDDENAIVYAYHDEPPFIPMEKSSDDINFSTHIVEVIEDFIGS